MYTSPLVKNAKKIHRKTKSKMLLKALQLGIEPRSPAQLPPKAMTSRNTNHYTTEDGVLMEESRVYQYITSILSL